MLELFMAAVATGAWGRRAVDSFLSSLQRSGDVGFALDVGSNDGSWARWLLYKAEARNLSLRVHVFEPQPRYAATLSALEERYHGSVRFHAAAAGTSSGTSWLYPATDRQAWSTVAAMARAYTTRGALREPLRVPSVDLAAFVGTEVNATALLKLDVEGAEYAIVPRLIATGAICRVRHLLIEWHLNALPPHERLAGLGLRFSFEHLVRAGCAGQDDWRVEHDEHNKNNFGEAVHGLCVRCKRNFTKKTRWS